MDVGFRITRQLIILITGLSVGVVTAVAGATPAAAAPSVAQQNLTTLSVAQQSSTTSSGELPSAFATEGVRSVTLSSSFKRQGAPNARRAKVKKLGNGVVRIVMFGVRGATVGTADGEAFRAIGKERAWTSLGEDAKGVIAGITKQGKRVRTPVVFDRVRFPRGNKVVVRATLTDGVIAPIAAPYVPNLKGVDATIRRGGYRQITVTGFPEASKNWTWTDNGRGAVKVQGSTIRVRLPKAHARAFGVQAGGQSASTAWAHLAGNWASYTADGAAPSLVVTGVQRNRQVRSAVAIPTQLIRRANGTVIIEASLAPRSSSQPRQRPPKGRQRMVYTTVQTPGSGNTTSYVMVAGDSIASGEGARYGGTYINPALQKGTGLNNLPTPAETAQRLALFCDSVDLACKEAKVGADGLVTYVSDPGQVYEEGSWEDVGSGQACHRSKTAPGTWLARYYATQVGLDVESITLACSGATTDNIIDTPFKGEAPQAQDLAKLAAWLPISHVVATIGANDIRFNEIATACLRAPVDAILGPTGLPPGGATEVLARIGRIFDDTRRATDGSVQSANPYFDPAELCSETQGPIVEKAVADVRTKVSAAMQALHRAAPDAQVVLATYPSLVPASTHTYYPRQEWFDSFRPQVLQANPDATGTPDCTVDPLPAECGDPGEYLGPWRVTLEGNGPTYWPSADYFDSDPRAVEPFVDGVAAGNPVNVLIAQNVYAGLATQTESGQQLISGDLDSQLLQLWAFELTALTNILGYGATQFGFDQDWAAQEVVPSLNRALVAGLGDADPAGEWSTPVEMTQVLNGRELGSKFAGHTDGPFDAVWGFTGTGPGPKASRAQMVNNIFSGQSLPFLCPGPESVAGAAGPGCVGDLQEALHPNWRGQAAQGQCIVAVVTGAFGQQGNACIRSIGDGSPGREYQGTFDDLEDPTLFSEVTGEDVLCLTDLENAYSTEQGQYQSCSSSTPADPTWDTERWTQGKVTWDGQDVHWR